MTSPDTGQLLSRDHGLDASSPDYPRLVRSVLLAPHLAADTAGPDQGTQLAARTVSALDEVARWANDGQSADPTACAWLAYLRWAVANGVRLPDDAPAPPSDDLDRNFPLLASPGPHDGDSFTALASGRLGEVLRPVLPHAESPEVLARTAPYGLVPNIGWKALIALALDSAAITHGSPEAQTAATATALAVHAAARAHLADTVPGDAEVAGASLSAVVAETARVAAEITRPAPRTAELLALCADPAARSALWSTPDALVAAMGSGTTASESLALGLAALLAVEDADDAGGTLGEDEAGAADEHFGPRSARGDDVARAACALLTDRGVDSPAARTVVAVVAAARWGLVATDAEALTNEESPADSSRDHPVGSGTDPIGVELRALAEQWTSLWCP